MDILNIYIGFKHTYLDTSLVLVRMYDACSMDDR